jgi:hypothetical protein
MEIHEIKRDTWAEYFDHFTKRHQGIAVLVETYGPGTVSPTDPKSLPLAGITYEPKGDSLEILLGTKPDDHISHTVTHPSHIWSHPNVNGDVLEVRSSGGITFLLRFAHRPL